MADILGTDVGLPNIDITGFLSNTWFYVLIVAIIGVFLIGGVIILLFMKTWNRKVVLFENISGQGFQPYMKTRARVIKLGLGGEEILKTFGGGQYLSAYGRKMGKNTYWYAKGSDGYLYNIILGDLDAKRGVLDVEPIDRDVRMLHVAINQLNQNTYNKKSFLEKYGVHMMLFLFLIVLILGIWFIVGKVGNATSSLSQTAETNVEVAQTNRDVLNALDNILNRNPSTGVISTEEG